MLDWPSYGWITYYGYQKDIFAFIYCKFLWIIKFITKWHYFAAYLVNKWWKLFTIVDRPTGMDKIFIEMNAIFADNWYLKRKIFHAKLIFNSGANTMPNIMYKYFLNLLGTLAFHNMKTMWIHPWKSLARANETDYSVSLIDIV